MAKSEEAFRLRPSGIQLLRHGYAASVITAEADE